jgi:hypothetical protein
MLNTLVVAKFKYKLAVNTQTMYAFHMGKFNLKNLNLKKCILFC